MAISSVTTNVVKRSGAFFTQFSFTWTPDNPGDQASEPYVLYDQDGSDANFAGYPYGYDNGVLSPSISRNGDEFSCEFEASAIEGEKIYYRCGLFVNSTYRDESGDSSYLNQPINSGPANDVTIEVSANEVPVGGTLTVTVTAANAGGATSGRGVAFGYKTGTAKGDFSPAIVNTNAQGVAVSTLTAIEPGQCHVLGRCDGKDVGIKVKFKN